MYPMPGWLFQAEVPQTEQQTEQPPKQGQRPYEAISQMLPIVAIFIMIIFILWLPRRREQKERETLLNSMKKGDEVLTHGGIKGTVHSVAEKEDEVIVEIASGVRIKLVKAGIIRNYTAEVNAGKPAGGETKKS